MDKWLETLDVDIGTTVQGMQSFNRGLILLILARAAPRTTFTGWVETYQQHIFVVTGEGPRN